MWRILCALALFLLPLAGYSPARADCPDGAVKWDNGHCYEAVLAPGVSWDQAQALCVARGGHLATITSAEENEFVFSLVSGNPSFWFLDGYDNGLGAWLGGYQLSGSGGPAAGWRWVTNEPFDTYTNWEIGQPGDMEDLEQNRLRFFKAGGLIGSRWDDCEADNPLEHRLGYILEYDSDTSGNVEDGYGHKLGGVEVTLLAPSPGGSTTTAVTLTDDEGEYSFNNIDAGDYQIEVALEYYKKVGDTPLFSVNYDTGTSVHAQTETFEVTDGIVARDISFADADLIPAAGIPQDYLDDLAGMYYHTKQVFDFESQELGFTPDLDLPIEVHGYVTDNPSTTNMDESQTCYYDNGQVYLGTSDSDYDDDDRPVTREWHEMFHELMDDTVGFPPNHTGDENHDGYYNHCTGDSWVEGWANFWGCALKRSLGAVDWYCFWDSVSLEFNWQVWDFDGGISREEFAAASLLVDLIDPVDASDRDYISVSTGQLWAIIGTRPLANMYEVYIALTVASIGQSDTNANGKPDLDDLFIAHGFFADDGNRQYDTGEDAGWGGKMGRTSILRVPDAYLRIMVAASRGDSVSDGTLLVDVVFESPLDIYNYSYEVELGSPDRLVYFEVAPDRYNPLIKMRVRDSGGNLSDEFTLSNTDYWQKVSESATGYADEHTFVIGTVEETTGGVPVWVWPVVGLAVVAVGAGGFLLLRKRAKAV